MSFLALELLQSLEHSKASARFMFSGNHGHSELWIEHGEIKQIEGCSIESLRKLLLQSPVEVWVRPLEAMAIQGNQNLNIQDLAFEAAAHHDLGNDEMMSSRNQTMNLPGLDQLANLIDPNDIVSQPTAILSDASKMKTASYPLQEIAKKNDTHLEPDSEYDSIAKTNACRSIQFTEGQPEKKTIGRNNQCSIVIIDRKTSRQHCEINYDGTHLMVSDLQSTNGTFLNGTPITQATKTQPGDILKVGNAFFIISVI